MTALKENMDEISGAFVNFLEQLEKLSYLLESSFYDPKLERAELGPYIKKMLKETDYCASELVKSKEYLISKETKDANQRAYDLKDMQKQFMEDLRNYKKTSDRTIPLPPEIVKHIDNVLSTEPYLVKAEELVEQNLDYLRRIEEGGTELWSMEEEKKKQKKENADVTPAGKALAMVTILALGFVMLNGLNNLGAIPPGGEMQGVVTGFYLLSGGPFVSSMQMVLFLLASAVVIVYLFGKSAGEW